MMMAPLMGTPSGGLRRSGSSSSSSSSSSSFLENASLKYETDDEFDKLIKSYDVVAVAEALRRYLALEMQSR